MNKVLNKRSSFQLSPSDDIQTKPFNKKGRRSKRMPMRKRNQKLCKGKWEGEDWKRNQQSSYPNCLSSYLCHKKNTGLVSDYQLSLIWVLQHWSVCFNFSSQDKILNTIINNTNLYAISKDASSAGCAWQPIDSDELVTWIMLTVYIGLHRMSRFDSCWSTNKQELIHMISQYMKKIWYQQIKRYLHLSVLVFLIIEQYTKTEPIWTQIFGFGWTIYMNWKVSYWFQLCLKIIWTGTLDSHIWKLNKNELKFRFQMDHLYETKSFVSLSTLKQTQPDYMNRNASLCQM